MTGPLPGSVREAQPTDIPQILQMIRELAEYEREPDAVATSEADLNRALFEGGHTPGGQPAVFCLVVDADSAAGPGGDLAGMALWFLSYSTWVGRHGIYLEDLFVRPTHRGRGHGRALLTALAAICVDNGYGRLEWSVLDWNEPAIGFYRSLGAVPMSEWTVNRLSGDALAELAAL